MVMIDYRKAFDMVDHMLLLKKLAAYGVDNDALQWFGSYLNDRQQVVKLGNKHSSAAFIRHGLPQGSILGPLLFITFINDLPLYVTSSNVDLYADDTTLTSSTKFDTIDSLQETLNSSLADADSWATSNKLPINESKTKVIVITGKRLHSKLNGGNNLKC